MNDPGFAFGVRPTGVAGLGLPVGFGEIAFVS